jgi:hypothetical protein
VLLKTKLGYKDNFTGIVSCDAALDQTEISRADVSTHEYIALAGQGIFEELYIRHRIGDRMYDVYFDLN